MPEAIAPSYPKTRAADGTYLPPPVKRGDLDDEVTGEQLPGRPMGLGYFLGTAWGYGGYYPYFGNGGMPDNPMAYPGWWGLYTGTYITYRWMLQHPIVRFVRSICVGIIGASTWEFENRSGAPEDLVKLVSDNMNDMRSRLINDFFLRGRDYGWTCGEPLWIHKDGKLIYKDIKPLLNDISELLQLQDTGETVGIRNSAPRTPGSSLNTDLAGPYKAFWYTYDGEAGNPYGRSWLENMRATAWREWLACSQQLQALGVWVTGTRTIVKSPSGTFPGPPDPVTGKATRISYRENAMKVIKDLSNGAAGVWLPSLGIEPGNDGKIDAMKVIAQLAKESLTNIEILKAGDQAQSIKGILDRMRHAEENMFAAGLRSARTGLEGEHGTKEEAGVHTDTGTLNAETEQREFCRQCQPLANNLIMLNAGPKHVNGILLKPSSLVDRHTQVLRAVLLAVLNDRNVAVEAVNTMDIDWTLKQLGIRTKKPFDPDAVAKALAAEAASRQSGQQQQGKIKQPEPEGGRPKED